MKQPVIPFEKVLREAVAARGGFVNAHAHYNRSYTLTEATLGEGAMPLKWKWEHIRKIKAKSSEDDFRDRIERSIDAVRSFGTTASITFIDVDDPTEDRALKAALTVRDRLGDEFPLKLANLPYEGVLSERGHYWFDRSAELVDIIGGMPEKDAPHNDQHLDTLLKAGKRLNKLVHVHVDQFNSADETETELLAQKTIEHGMEGRVWAVHSVSVAAHTESRRKKIYQLLKDAGVGVIVCPVAYMDERRFETVQPFHLPIFPIEEAAEFNIPIAVGTDNISDVMKPLADGDMWLELRMAIEMCRMYDRPIDKLVEMVTVNGRKALGLPQIPLDPPLQKGQAVGKSPSFAKRG